MVHCKQATSSVVSRYLAAHLPPPCLWPPPRSSAAHWLPLQRSSVPGCGSQPQVAARRARCAAGRAASSSGAGSLQTQQDDNWLASLKVADLKAELKTRGLSTTGLKADLQERLRAALAQAGAAGHTSAGSAGGSHGQANAGQSVGGAGTRASGAATAAPSSTDVAIDSAAQQQATDPGTLSGSPAPPQVSASSAGPLGEEGRSSGSSSLQQASPAAASKRGKRLNKTARVAMMAAKNLPGAARSRQQSGSGNAAGSSMAASAGSVATSAAAGGAGEDQVASQTGLAVTWLGTSSGAPTPRRNISCIALRLPQAAVLVDCGEGSFRQLQRTPGIHLARIRGVCVTHLHGDHCFGLPGLLTAVSQAREGTPLQDERFCIFGPPGIQELLRAALQLARVAPCMPLAITEFTQEPGDAAPLRPADATGHILLARLAPDQPPGQVAAAVQAARAQYSSAMTRGPQWEQLPLHARVVVGLTWTCALPAAGGLTITTAQLKHRVPCWGYVFQEAHTPPAIDAGQAVAAGLSEREVVAQLEAAAARRHAPAVIAPDGRAVPLGQVVAAPAQAGRKVVLLGDTCYSGAIADVGAGADLLSHEATFAEGMEAKARIAQHSTAAMAGAFARRINARALVLTHFSARYEDGSGRAGPARAQSAASDGEEEEDVGQSTIDWLLRQARATFRSAHVTAACDFYTFQVPQRDALPLGVLPQAPPAARQAPLPQAATQRQPKQPQRQRVAA